MAWYYHLNGENVGPIEVTELQRLQQTNVIAPNTLVWTEGMAQWEPFQSSRAVSPTVGAQGAVATQVCSECAKRFPEDEMLHYENSWICPSCKPIFFQKVREGVAPQGTFAFANVGTRFLAILIDGFVLVLVFIVLMIPFILFSTLVVSSDHKTLGENNWFVILIVLLEYILPPVYEIFFIGKYGATPGKKLMKIKVVRADGSRVSYARATGRYFAKILSALILYIGFLMAFWDEEKRALHDHICNTRVIKNPS